MPRLSASTELKRLVDRLQAERQEHLHAVAEIERTFNELGLGAGKAPAKRGRPAGSGKGRVGRPAKRRTRGSFSVSGEDSVVKFITGNPGATTKDVNGHWQAEGRKGKADNTLTKLVKARKLKRTKIKGERGSKYHAA